jgi:serine/threonine-protein kinase
MANSVQDNALLYSGGVEPPLQTLGRYRILRFLARGGMGELYVAVDPAHPGEEVVLKCVRASRRFDQFRGRVRMFLDEAGVATRVDHPNVVRVHAVDYEAGVYYLVMEKLEGRDLGTVVADRSRRNELIPLPLVGRLIIEACHGLHAAHQCTTERGEALELVHRDVSPANLFVTTDGILKVLDFGVAKTTIQTHETQVGLLKGKVSYMSPEQARGERLDRRSDIFSIGVVLHELLTGRRLFSRRSQSDTLRAVLDELVAPPTRADGSVDEALQGVTMRALQRNRGLRYSTALDLAAALERELPAACAVEGKQVAALVTDINADDDDGATTTSWPVIDANALADWATELTEQISRTDAPRNTQRDTDTAVTSAPVFERTRRLTRWARTPLWPSITATVLAGVALGTGVWFMLIDNEKPVLEATSPPARSTARSVTRVPEPPNPRPPERRVIVEPTKDRRGQAARQADASSSEERTTARATQSSHHSVPKPLERRSSTPPAPSHRRQPPRQPRPAHPVRSDAKPHKARETPPVPATGILTLDASPWANVYLGDRLLGATPLVERKLRAGRVTLRLVNPETGQKRTVSFDIPAGGVLRRAVTLE